MAYDVNDLAGQIYPIVGAGIGIGLLAGMSQGIMRTMYPQNDRTYHDTRPRRYARPYKTRPYRQAPYRRYVRPRYGYW